MKWEEEVEEGEGEGEGEAVEEVVEEEVLDGEDKQDKVSNERSRNPRLRQWVKPSPPPQHLQCLIFLSNQQLLSNLSPPPKRQQVLLRVFWYVLSFFD